MQDVEQTLEGLASREDGPYVVRLPREPGKRESRYMHLFSGDVEPSALAVVSDTPASNESLTARVAARKTRLPG